MLFRQLFDRESCTYTYLLADEETREAVIIDPVREHLDRDLKLLGELGLHLGWVLETHVHADHVTSSGLLRERLGARTAVSREGGADCASMQVQHGDLITFGRHRIEARATPGHTSGCMTYVLHEQGMAFTGDTLMVRGCGRTDFQQGSAAQLFASVWEQIFTLPDTTTIYPGHDYKGFTCTTVAEEKAFNPRLGMGNSLEQFEEIMANLNLSYPGKIDIAVPANQQCGWLPGDEPRGVAESGAWAPLARTAGGVPEVKPAWVAASAAGLKVVDVREPHEFTSETGHLEGAINVPLGNLAEVARGWDPKEPVVVLCRSGGRSGQAAVTLEGLGFAKVVSMAGGMLAWQAEGWPAVGRAG